MDDDLPFCCIMIYYVHDTKITIHCKWYKDYIKMHTNFEVITFDLILEILSSMAYVKRNTLQKLLFCDLNWYALLFAQNNLQNDIEKEFNTTSCNRKTCEILKTSCINKESSKTMPKLQTFDLIEVILILVSFA